MIIVYFAKDYKKVQDYMLEQANIYIPLEDIASIYEFLRGTEGFRDVPIYCLNDETKSKIAKAILERF